MINKNQKITIATIGSHSALEVARGAKDEGFSNIVVCERGREKTYAKYYKTLGDLGCVDEIILIDKFEELLKPDIQKKLIENNSIFIPNRSFEVYLKFDYDRIEKNFNVPMFGNKKLLRIEERGFKPNQYDLLDEAKIRYPKQFKDPKKIDRICLVKVLEKERGFERAFFIVDSYEDYQRQTEQKMFLGIFTEEQLKKAVIEEFIFGVQVNFNFFYSPLHDRLELLGTDTRRQTNLDGITKLPINYQEELLKKVSISYEEASHTAVTVLESILEQAFEIGERFVKASKKLSSPGVIGPFALQSFITPGPPKKDIVVIDVSPRFPGSPGITATPYSGYLFGQSVNVGRRIAMEIKEAQDNDSLDKIIT
jgi:5-formaminoimidazole-4-carboxamide-1-(beta)-D-ribofuranosyl 5'-monophosphate synthetase